MASRNLTKKFIELRNGAKASRNLGMRDESDGESGLLKVKNSCSTLIHQTDAVLTFYNFFISRKATKQSGATTATRFRRNGSSVSKSSKRTSPRSNREVSASYLIRLFRSLFD